MISVSRIVELLEKRENISNVAIDMLVEVTGMEVAEIEQLSIQNGLAILTKWLVETLNNPLVSDIRALELFPPFDENEEEKIEHETFTIIKNVRFRDRITLADWKKAESLSVMFKKEHLFTLYLFSVCCTEGRQKGVEIFSKMGINSEILESMREYNNKQLSNPHFSIDLLTDFKYLVIGTKKRLLLNEAFFLPKFL